MSAQPKFRFDAKNPSAQSYAARHAARFVTRVSNQTREALRALIVASIDTGITATEVAERVRDMVGLTAQDAGAVAAFEAGMFKQGVLNRASIMKQVYRMAQRSIRRRALTIARTEIMGALNGGTLAAAEQAVELGLLDPGTAVKLWLVSRDEITPPCVVCMPLDHAEVPLYAMFHTMKNQKEVILACPPAHPRCRCSFTVLPESRKKRR